MSEPISIEQQEQAFHERVTHLKNIAQQWVERPIAPEAEVLSAIIFLMTELGELMIETQKSHTLLQQELRTSQRAEFQYVRQQLDTGVEAVRTLKTINESVVKKQVSHIIGNMTSDLRLTINNQATLMVKRYNIETAFRIMLYCSIVLFIGFFLGRI